MTQDARSVFIRPDDYYVRELSPVRQYVRQNSHFVSRVKGIPLEVAQKKIEDIVKQNIKDPTVVHSLRAENGDRGMTESSLSTYIRDINHNEWLVAPTFTVYLNPKERRSVYSEYMADNKKERKEYKKKAKEAKANKDLVEAVLYNNLQNSKKIFNNSMSGAFGKRHGVFSNPTSHSTLTTVVRMMTSIANMCNERFLRGNRYYATQSDLLNNVIFIASSCDSDEIGTLLKKYKLHVPTVEDVVGVLKLSTDLYWKDQKFYDRIIIPYLEKLTGEERAAVVYEGDLYHIAMFNRAFMEEFLDTLTERVKSDPSEGPLPTSEMFEDTDILSFTHLIFYDAVKGIGLDYSKLDDKPDVQNDLVATARGIKAKTQKYKDFIQGFFVNRNMPFMANKMKTMARASVAMSDTDSTAFSVDEWINWRYGSISITDRTIAFAGGVIYLATQVLAHYILMYATNMNVEKEKRRILSMKNEYFWLVFLSTSASKHYAGLTAVVEGNVYDKPELEIKGVHLKNSAAPPEIINEFHAHVKQVLIDISQNKKISAQENIDRVIEREESIHNSILSTEAVRTFKKQKIKEAEAYGEGPLRSPYQHYTLWCRVFEPKYGPIRPPPYRVCKIPTVLTKPALLNAWIDNLPLEMKDPAIEWFTEHNKKMFGTFYIPIDFISSYGIPKEIIEVIDIKRIQLELTVQDRTFLESLNISSIDGLRISEQYKHSRER